MRISLIVAMSQNRVIGARGELPWRLSADLVRFKRLTMGRTIVMGRKTFESIGRLLPGRTSVVVTRQGDFEAPGALVAHDLEAALRLKQGDDEVFIIGGGEIYRHALPLADRIYLTLVQTIIEGDTTFPALNAGEWRLAEESQHAADAKNEYPHCFRILDRVKSAARSGRS